MNLPEGLLQIGSDVVRPEWLDYNQHMTEGFYGVAFANASDEWLVQLGFDAAYRERTGCSFYTVETHIHFRRELKVGDPLDFYVQVLGADPKRLHLFQWMVHAGEGFVAATQEIMLLHVHRARRQVVPMEEPVYTRCMEAASRHAHLPRPAQAGRGIRSVDKPAK